MSLRHFLRRLNRKSPLASAALGALTGAAGATLGGMAGGSVGNWLGGSGGGGAEWGQKIGGALGGGIGATLPSIGSGAGFDYNAATLGGLGGYQMGPSLANWGTQTAGKLGDALKPQGLTTPVSQPFGRPGQGMGPEPTQRYPSQGIPGQQVGPYRPQIGPVPGGRTTTQTQQIGPAGTPGVGQALGNMLGGGIGQSVVSGVLASTLTGKQPEFPAQSEYYGPASEQFQGWMTGAGAVPGLNFDQSGNLTGVNPQEMPPQVHMAIGEIDKLAQQQVEALRNEAARAGMLGSTEYVKQAKELQTEVINAKKEIYSGYVSQAMTMAQQRAIAGAQAMGQMGNWTMEQYNQQMADYKRRSDAIAKAVGGWFEQQESEKDKNWMSGQMAQNRQYYSGALGG